MAAAAGIDLHIRQGQSVDNNQPLFTLHAESAGELAYALDYINAQEDIIVINPN
ncbi:MAG: hypothetical protein RLT30_05865 [Gammaproteobacteria bacterium]